MDIRIEKKRIIKRLEDVTDESLIMTVKNILDYALGKDEHDERLEQSINRGIEQSKAGQVQPHKEVMAKMRSKYKIGASL